MWSREEFCLRAGIAQTTLQVWVEEGWLAPREGDADLLLSEVDLARARLIRDLRESIGVNDEGVGVILNLLDQVHGLRAALFDLRRQLGGVAPTSKE
ncbi:chaperone modulator CbpM [Microvirga massiliensis]|uniref:chaperone modulator CbpM n=1 Tax=Microvirga massiliensis TaxID=1033741 RepID=UPI00062B8F16|nr:chaperone modulator CbpM [Microvirga massiliensis]